MAKGKDPWLCEFEEAMKLADDVMQRIQERNEMIAQGEDPARLISATRRKIIMLGTKADRMEAMLKNPPETLTISEKELYRRRDMLMGVRYRTKQMAASLSTSANVNRGQLLGDTGKRQEPPSETEKTAGLDNRGVLSMQKQIMKEQDDELKELATAVTSTKHIALTVNEELDLHNRLLDDLDRDVQGTQSRMKVAQTKLANVGKRIGKGCSVLCLLLVIIALIVIVIALLDILR
ncbi:hypothetical protein CBR_g90925 [Chara braunii]|uniref:t-SNARE coiled-coil homology domain-containing protein n=1 Tax=Chara braunii TaxID=69332 RepID=A0A388JL62_CHABU|nr:hypothetical protein CBR_g90925 [Chara braunii]|eukprot:GBG48415.1 hypothetical protein CBR_g90925 [Chara braunii]